MSFMDEEFSKLSDLTVQHLIRFSISVGIGFLIGLERQFSKEVNEKEEQFAGVRTYSLVSIFGFVSAFLTSSLGTWFFGVALVCMLALVIVSYIRLSAKPGNKGGTSEITTIITFLLGAMVFFNFILIALIIMAVMLLLLAFKPNLHGFVERLNREELFAIIQFVIMSALVMPFLPDQNFGPYDLWNLKDIWKMVILVSGTSLVGYMIAKVLGNKGTLVAGVVGGLVSSTSVALTFSRRSKEAARGASFYYLIGIISASTIMFPRILFEVFVVNRNLAKQLWLPVLLITLAGFGAAFLIYKIKKGKTDSEELPLRNPLNFSTAIKFALFYAAIQWLVKFSSESFGDNGTYLAGAISGITDVDAITLSMAKLAKGTDKSMLAINTILLAALSNTMVKFLITLLLGTPEWRKISVIGFACIFITGLAYLGFRIFL
jgi:uncharacterized membrane protein (DUF4010 family)